MTTCARTSLFAAVAAGGLLAIPIGDPVAAQERDCKDERIQAAGAASVFGKGRALSLAITSWQREVRNKYGERYMQWDKAVEKKDDCDSASVGALGKFNQRCTVAGVPCASGNLDSPEDRYRETYRDRDRDRRVDPAYERERERDYERYYDRRRDIVDVDPREIQRLLNRWGYEVRADGVWGEESRSALMRFQRRVGLDPDGEPGPQTLAELRRRPR